MTLSSPADRSSAPPKTPADIELNRVRERLAQQSVRERVADTEYVSLIVSERLWAERALPKIRALRASHERGDRS